MKTALKNRTLWFDGTSEVDPTLVPELLLTGVGPNKISVTELNDDIRSFNLVCDTQISTSKTANRAFDLRWDVPEKFIELDLEEYIDEQLAEFLYVKSIPQDRWGAYRDRTAAELKEIQARGVSPLFRTIVYIVSRLKETGVVWGVGRGSSCASLVLFLIGLHKVDPVKFAIPMEEFFHN